MRKKSRVEQQNALQTQYSPVCFCNQIDNGMVGRTEPRWRLGTNPFASCHLVAASNAEDNQKSPKISSSSFAGATLAALQYLHRVRCAIVISRRNRQSFHSRWFRSAALVVPRVTSFKSLPNLPLLHLESATQFAEMTPDQALLRVLLTLLQTE